MKTRHDFVSNSSSCSFFIELDTQEAIDAFKAVSKNFNKNEVFVTVYDSLDDVESWNGFTGFGYIDNLELGDWVKCDSGEDHDDGFMARFERMAGVVDSSPFKFKIYEDPDAHTTHCCAMEFPR